MTAPQAVHYTQCPGCLTVFRIHARQLEAAGGRVRCGLCGEYFDAGRTLTRLLPADLPTTPGRHERARGGGHQDVAEPAAAEPAPSEPESSEFDVVLPRPAEPDWGYTTALEMESAASTTRSRPRRWIWALGCLLALLMLAGQWIWFERQTLALEPAWRSWIAGLCGVAGCELPPLHRPEAVAVVARTLREHPELADALLFTATLVNRADAPQRWPQLGLTLLGVNGRALGRRWFTAREYLVNGERVAGPMPPGQPVAVRLEIQDPGPGAVGFEIAFR